MLLKHVFNYENNFYLLTVSNKIKKKNIDIIKAIKYVKKGCLIRIDDLIDLAFDYNL